MDQFACRGGFHAGVRGARAGGALPSCHGASRAGGRGHAPRQGAGPDVLQHAAAAMSLVKAFRHGQSSGCPPRPARHRADRRPGARPRPWPRSRRIPSAHVPRHAGRRAAAPPGHRTAARHHRRWSTSPATRSGCSAIESGRKALLARLTDAETLPAIPAQGLPGTKRFSIEAWTCWCRCSTSPPAGGGVRCPPRGDRDGARGGSTLVHNVGGGLYDIFDPGRVQATRRIPRSPTPAPATYYGRPTGRGLGAARPSP